MTVEVLLDTPEITVIGTPATVEVLVDYGATGPRGSQIFSGIDNPNSVAPSATLYANDLYIMKSGGSDTGGIYQYLSDGIGGYQWTKINDFNPVDWTVGQSLSVKTGSYSLLPTDVGTIIRSSGSTAITLTVSASTNFAAGQRANFFRGGSGSVTFAGSGVTLRYTPTAKMRAQYSWVTLVCLGTNEYVLKGDLASS